MIELTSEAGLSYKIGVLEIKGLRDAMRAVMHPIREAIKSKVYWSDVALHDAEYKSRDGFFAHSHNCGGVQIFEVIPKCEEYNFEFLEFGECDYYADPEFADSCGPDGTGCNCDDEGHLSASLQVFLKFEGYDKETGELSFYLILHGGNSDAPYFRQSNDIFEAEFTCKSVEGLNRAASKHIKKLLKAMGD